MAEYSQKWHNGTSKTRSTETSDGLAAIQVPTTPNIAHSRKKGKPSNKLTTHNLVHLFKEGDIEQLLWDSTKGTMQIIRASVSVMPLSTYLNLGLGELAHTKLTVELADMTVKYPRGIAENVLVSISIFVLLVDFIILDMPEDIKVPLILERQFLYIAHAKINVFKRKITLRVGDEKKKFKSMKPASSMIKRVYMLSLRERMELDLEARLIGETLVLNRSLDHLYGDYTELNDLNVPLYFRRDQVDDLMPYNCGGEIINEPMIDIIKTRNNESFDEYPSFCDFDWKIHIDCAYNLRFSCMIVVENIDGYRDQDMGDAIFGEPFCKASCVKARRFDEIITIHNGNDNVTYQMTADQSEV
ncbi:gag-pol polyprotein [Tanacetum coccineum]